MTKRDFTDDELDALFTAQRQTQVAPSPEFLQQIAQDATRSAGLMRPVMKEPSTWDRLVERAKAALNTGGLSGSVIAAGLTGIWIGVAAPQGVPDPALLWSTEIEADSLDMSSLVGDMWFTLDTVDQSEWEDG
ncbi:MAG: hypothetical protein ABJL99_17750 [Aliishimia sp.]